MAFFYRTIQRDNCQGNIYKGPKRSFDTYCVIFEFFSVGPKMLLKTQTFEEKRHPLQRRKDFGLFFSYYPVWRTSRNELWGSKKQRNTYCGSYKIISLTPKRLMTTHFLKKKANFPVKKALWPNFPRSIECDKLHRIVYKGPKGLLTIIVEVIRSFL